MPVYACACVGERDFSEHTIFPPSFIAFRRSLIAALVSGEV